MALPPLKLFFRLVNTNLPSAYSQDATAPENTANGDEYAVSIRGLRKSYESLVALADVTCDVLKGEIFGVLGPNGAGKTTLIETLIGIRKADSGTFRILGLPGPGAFNALRSEIGVIMQSGVLSSKLRLRELVAFYLNVYNAKRSVDTVLRTVGLEHKASAFVHTLSGGQQRRCIVALAVVGNPKLMFVDEPTANLDPHARRVVWEILNRQRRELGSTIVLTTNQMDEAEALCDRVAILDGSRIVALDTPRRLVEAYCPERVVTFQTRKGVDFPIDIAELVDEIGNSATWRLRTSDVDHMLGVIGERATKANERTEGLRVDAATLEDVFLRITGHQVRE